MQPELLHTSVGCNRVVNSLDWGPNGLIAYGAHNAVVLYNPEEARIIATLHGHTGRVNCVKWISAEGFPGSILCSGAADGTIRVWVAGNDTDQTLFDEATVIEAHEGAVTAIECYSTVAGSLLLFSCAGDHTVKVWECQTLSTVDNFSLRQTVCVGSRLANCVAISSLPRCPGWILMAVGIDRTIKLMLASPAGEFQDKFTLVGHQDWVRSVSFMPTDDSDSHSDLVLASGAQDRNIRIWRATSVSAEATSSTLTDQTGLEDITRFASKHTFSAGQEAFTVALEAVLLGHEDWVHSVAWRSSRPGVSPCLLSASMDRTMMIWRPDTSQPGLWMSEQSLGDAGTNALGYFGGVFSQSGDGIVAHGFSGALHLWCKTPEEQWQAARASGGHFAGVVDCAWAFDGDCLMSASLDQTVRVHVSSSASGWYELARPQVHGHDLSFITPLPGQGDKITSFRYVSGAEEKILRVFQAPSAFSTSLQRAQGMEVEDDPQAKVAFGATVAALGLSNKAVYQGEDGAAEPQEAEVDGNYDYGPEMAPNPCPRSAVGPPFEEHLAQGTLWPETRKVFGHGNDLITVAASSSGTRVATACRAQNAATAAILVWDTSDWSAAGVLKAHNLTVTALEFSPDDRFILSASRDRSFALHSLPAAGVSEYGLVYRWEKAHDRIIWDVSWMPCSTKFVTCSRDKTVKLWEISVASTGV